MKRLGELSNLINARVVGDSSLEVSGAASVFRAGKGDITFAVSRKHVEHFLSGDAPAAVISATIHVAENELNGKSVLLAEDAENSFRTIVRSLRQETTRDRIGISQRAHVSDSAIISEDVDIFPGVFIGNDVEIGCGCVIHANVVIMDGCKIGRDVEIFPNSTLYKNTVVGDRCLIHAGAVLGANGFGYDSQDGKHQLAAQFGNVVLENDVEVGANTTIDRAAYDSTVIGTGTKLDNLVQIGHNCEIGRHNLLCSQVGIAGSTSTGDNVIMGGQVGVSDHVKISSGVTLGAKAGVMADLEQQTVYLGAPAIPSREFMQVFAATTKLPALRKQVKQLCRKVEELSSQPTDASPITQPDADAA